MFIPNKRYQQTVKFANDDLRKFFCHNFQSMVLYRETWLRARDEVIGFHPSSEREIACCHDAASFTESFLTWLEEAKTTVRLPWLKNEHISLDKNSASFAYLSLVKDWLEDFSTGARHIKEYPDELWVPSTKIFLFAQFVARECISGGGWTLLFQPKQRDQDLRGFVSWLIANPADKTLIVIYDGETIKSSSQDKSLVAQRLQNVFLHELGHARMNLGFILEAQASTLSSSYEVELSSHEAESWLYAHTVMGLILGMSSRINRLLGTSSDYEWW